MAEERNIREGEGHAAKGTEPAATGIGPTEKETQLAKGSEEVERGTQEAAKGTQEAAKGTERVVKGFGRAARGVGRAAKGAAKGVGRTAKSAGHATTSAAKSASRSASAARSARISRRAAPGAGLGLSSLIGAGIAGAALMYYADSHSGRRRRAEMRNKAIHAYKRAAKELDMAARDFSHRMQGMRAEARHRPNEEVDDYVLKERVRAKLGRYCSHPHAVEVRAQGGNVELFGPILAHEHKALVDGIESVPGVRHIEDRLHPYTSADNIPSLQGGKPRRGPRADFMQDNWAPATRMALGSLGVGLFMSSLRSRGAASKLFMLTGIGLFSRAFTNRPMKRVVGIGAGRYAVDLQKTVHVDAPVEEVFAFFQAMDNFPLFMDHIKDIHQVGPDRWHWKVTGPGNTSFEWDAEARFIPNERLTWKSVPGASVENAGIIHFERWGEGTRLHIQMTYNPPGGVLGHNIAKLLGSDPKKQMDEDMLRFKSIIEKGKATAHGHTVRREDLAVPPRGFSPALPS